MINKVSNMADLRAEKARLQLKKQSLEEAMKNDVKEIKENLNPFHFLKSKTGENTGSENGIVNNLIGTAVAFILDFLLTRIVFRKSGLLKKTVLSLLISMAGSKIIAGKSEAIISVIKNFIDKLKKEDADENLYRTTAADEN